MLCSYKTGETTHYICATHEKKQIDLCYFNINMITASSEYFKWNEHYCGRKIEFISAVIKTETKLFTFTQ